MKPIAITMGCPVGIGPEIILKYYLVQGNRHKNTVVIGDLEILQAQARHFNIDIPCSRWKPGDTVPQNSIAVYHKSALKPSELVWGAPDKTTGKAMAGYIETAVTLARKGDISAIVTCPITKTALQKAGYRYPGHTEMLADLCSAEKFTMMMAGPRLRITLVTIHCALTKVSPALTIERIKERIELTYTSLQQDFAIHTPRIGVAGLNPHAGESGIFGREEIEIIEPAISTLQKQGISVHGPMPPDTIFYKAAQGAYDAVVCMYHDQGLIPFKLLHFADGVNVTIGLPIVRTSVDHGTAYDIAGKGMAESTSLEAAVAMACDIAGNRTQGIQQ